MQTNHRGILWNFGAVGLMIFASGFLLSNNIFAADLSAQQIQQMVLAAGASHAKIVVIPPGRYRLTPAATRYHLMWNNLHHLLIDATGVTFICTNPHLGAIGFNLCDNVTFKGATVEFETPCFTQGKVVALGPDTSYIDVEIDPGWPIYLDDLSMIPVYPPGYVFDPNTRLWKRGVYELWLKPPVMISPRRFRLYGNRKIPAGAAPIEIGDLMAFRGIGVDAVHLRRSTQMTLENITVMSSGGYAVSENGGDGGNHYRNLRVTFGPTPPGANTPPLLSANEDGFHSTAVRHGPTVEDSLFEGMPDDGIAIHGLDALVLESKGNSITAVTQGYDGFRPGDTLYLTSPDGAYLVGSLLMSKRDLPDYRPRLPITNVNFIPPLSQPLSFHEFDLDEPVPAGFQYLISDENACGAGFALRRNIVRNNRARGIFVESSNGTIEDNQIDGSTICGILVGPESAGAIGGYMNNLIVRRNGITNVGYATTGPWETRPGAVTIAGENQISSVAPAQGNISIHDNEFDFIDGVNLMIDSSHHVWIKNNIFHNPQMTPSMRGKDAGIDPNALIYVSHSDDVRLEGNTVTNPPNTLEPVVTGNRVTNLSVKP